MLGRLRTYVPLETHASGGSQTSPFHPDVSTACEETVVNHCGLTNAGDRETYVSGTQVTGCRTAGVAAVVLPARQVKGRRRK